MRQSRPLRRRSQRSDRVHQARLMVEAMEDRLLLSTILVTLTTDSTAAGTLRNAITQANASPGSTINFQIPKSGVQTIALTSALPTITQPVTIDGTTQPGYGGSPLIELNGTSAGATSDGFDVQASNVTIKGLAINRFKGAGIKLLGGAKLASTFNNVIEYNFIGTDPTGQIALGNGGDGVLVTYNNNTNLIANNLISGNTGNGIYLNGLNGAPTPAVNPNPATTGDIIFGNKIGTNITGTVGLGNGQFGVNIFDAPLTQIGGPTAAYRNLISANLAGGIELGYGAGTQVQGNYIGTDVTGLAALGNGVANTLQARGILITYGSNILIGGTAPGAGNVISGNLGAGIDSLAALTPIPTGDTIQGNLVGTDATGTHALGNGQDGINLASMSGITIGGTAAGAGNVISNNGGNGINTFPGASNLTIQGNYIGTDITGTQAMGNAKTGVYIWTPVGVLIGGATPGAGNVISNNGLYGINTFTTGQTLTIQGNEIGTDVTGLFAMGNGRSGINATIANVSIGGTTPGAGNIIAYNGFHRSGDVSTTDLAGVLVSASPVSVFGNSIFGNAKKGIDLNGGLGNFGQTAPILTSASSGVSTATIAGTLASAPNTLYTIQFYSSGTADGTGIAEGQTFLGSLNVATDPNGQANIFFGLSSPIPSGQLVTATATDPNGNVSEFSASVVAAGASLGADLSVTVSPQATTVLAGTNQVYTVTVTNSSTSSSAPGVVLTNLLPLGATFITASASQGSAPTQSGDVVTAALGSLDPGASATVTITVTVGPSGNVPVTDIASAVSAIPDPDLTNNFQSAATTVTGQADVSVTITPPAINPAIEGQNETFVVSITNNGPNDAANVVLNNVLPRGITIVSTVPSLGLAPVVTAGTGGNAGTMVTTIGTLPAGFTATLTLIATTLPAAVPALNFSANVTSTTSDANLANNSAASSTPVMPVSDLGIAISAPSPALISQNMVYTVTVTNLGPNAAEGVVVTDTLPLNATYVSASASQSAPNLIPITVTNGILTANLGTVAANSVATISIIVVPNSFPSVVDSASVTTTTLDPVTTNNSATLTTNVTTDADISVAIASTPTPAQVGRPLTYTVTVTNNGPSPANNVVLVDTLDPNVTFVSAVSTAGGTPSRTGVNVTTNVGTLASGAFAIVTIIVTPTGPAAVVPVGGTPPPVITNTATANSTTVGTSQLTLDPNAVNNSLTVTTTVLPASDLRVTLVPSIPATGSLLAGAVLTYTATITNLGPNDATNVTFTAPLDPNVTYVLQSASSSTSGVTPTVSNILVNGVLTNVLTSVIATLAAGASDVETFQVSPNAAAVPTTTTTVTVASDNFDPSSLGNPLTSNNMATAITNVNPSTDLLVQLNTSATSALVGQQFTYTIDVTNFGPSDATGVVLTNILPANTTVVSATSTVGATPTVNGTTLTANISALPNGQTAEIVIIITPLTASVPTLVNSVTVTSTTTDPNTLNNTTSLTTSAALDSDLTLTVVPSVTSVQVGQNITYTYTVVNNGPNDATSAAITDPLPLGMSFVGGTVTVAGVVLAAPTLVGSSVVANLGTLVNLATATVTIILSPSQASIPSAVNIATVGSALIDPLPLDDTVTTTTTVTSLADVGVTITGPTSAVPVGQTVTYTINLINNGPNDASGVTINDVIPSSLINPSATTSAPGVTPTVTGNTVNVVLGTLTVGGTASVTITATSTSAAAPTVSNTVNVSSSTQDPNPANNQASTTVSVTPMADVSIGINGLITASPDPVQVGQNLVYTIDVFNNGPNEASGVTFSDILPANLTFISATSTLGSAPTYSAVTGAVTSSLGKIPAASTARITIQVVPTGALISGGTPVQVTNVVTIASQSIDSNSFNNSAQVTSTVTPSADLALSLVPSAGTVLAGQNVTYTIAVVNNGPSSAQTPMITDQLPPGLTFVSASTSTGLFGSVDANGLVTIPIGTLASGATATAMLIVTPSALVTTTIPNTASVSSGSADPNSANNASTKSVIVNPSADIGVTITSSAPTVTAGQDVTYTINVTNNSPATTASDVTITNVFPTNAAFKSSSTNSLSGIAPTTTNPTVSLGALAPGATVVVTITVTPGATGVPSIIDSVSITSQPSDPVSANNSALATTSVTAMADIGVTISAPTSFALGANPSLTYQVIVHNYGPSKATGVVVTNTLPPLNVIGNIQASTNTGTTGVAGNVVTANIGDLPANQDAVVTINIAPNAGAVGTITDTATVSNQVPDLNQANNFVTATTTVTSIADVGVSSAAAATVNAGGALSYQVTVINHGPGDAAGVVLSDVLPPGVTFQSGTSTLGSPVTNIGGTVTANIGTLRAGATDTFVIILVPGAAAAGTLANRFTVTTDSTDPSPTNNASTSQTTVVPVSDISVTLTASAGSVVVGQSLTYLATVTNNGPSSASGVTLSNALPAGLTFLGATASNGTTPTSSGNNVTAALGTLAPSESVKVFINVAPAQAAVPTVANTVNVTANGTDPNSLNNSASTSTTITPIDVLSVGASPAIAATVAGQPLSGVVVAAFSDANSSATAASFTASINWGDGSPATVGTVVPNSSGGVNVIGSHTYTSAPSGGARAFNVTTTITAASGASLQSTTQANVSVVPLALTGQLNPSSDSGASNQDAITNNTQPNFNGTSTPGAVITLVAQPTGGGSAFQIAQTTTNAGGFWNVNTSRIADGSYVVTAIANDSFGQTKSSTLVPALKIDTTPPTVGPITFSKATGQLSVALQDNQAGFNLGSLLSGFIFKNAAQKKGANLAVGTTAQPPANGATSETMLLTIKGGKKIKSGNYTLTIPATIQDLAGNSLGRNLTFAVKPAKNKAVAAQAKVAALSVHDAAIHTLQAPGHRRHRVK